MPKLKKAQKELKFIDIPLVPTIGNNWDKSIQVICANKFYKEGEVSKAQEIQLNQLKAYWALNLHWVYKLKFNNKHKIPCPRWLATGTKPLSEVYLAMANLCEAIHNMGHPLVRNYAFGSQWFDSICREIQRNDIKECLGHGEAKTLTRKAELIREDIKLMRDCQNPFDPVTDVNGWRLIEAVIDIDMTRVAPNITNNLWRGKKTNSKAAGFLAAYSRWAKFLKDSPTAQRIYCSDNKLFITTGRGRGKQLVWGDK